MRIIVALRDQILNHAHLTSAEWAVISRMCGTAWDEDPDGYWPPATPKPGTF